MNLTGKLIQSYFNLAYNQVYDATTARISYYRTLQQKCISKLEFQDGDMVLCVGIGTGNEINCILEENGNVNIVGVDYSATALKKAHQKALRLGKEIQVAIMDVQQMQFATESFDKVVCLHVMDFVQDPEITTGEIIRVLKDGGQFVVTYPSRGENFRLASNLLKEGIRHDASWWQSRAKVFREILSLIATSFVYLPLFTRSGKKSYNNDELHGLVAGLASIHFQVEEDPIYHDFIVYGHKESCKGDSDASRGQVFSNIQ